MVAGRTVEVIFQHLPNRFFERCSVVLYSDASYC